MKPTGPEVGLLLIPLEILKKSRLCSALENCFFQYLAIYSVRVRDYKLVFAILECLLTLITSIQIDIYLDKNNFEPKTNN